MEIYESFRRTNFMLIYTMIIMHILHMLKYVDIPPSVSCLFYSMVCLHVGATRSLNYYNVKQETSKDTQITNTENSLMTLKNALSIPVIATLSLLAAYFAVINKWNFVN